MRMSLQCRRRFPTVRVLGAVWCPLMSGVPTRYLPWFVVEIFHGESLSLGSSKKALPARLFANDPFPGKKSTHATTGPDLPRYLPITSPAFVRNTKYFASHPPPGDGALSDTVALPVVLEKKRDRKKTGEAK